MQDFYQDECTPQKHIKRIKTKIKTGHYNYEIRRKITHQLRGLPFIFRALLFFKIFPIKIYTLLYAFEPIAEALLPLID